MMELWGDKTISFFDVWSLEHFFSGASIGILLVNRWPKHSLAKNMLLILTAAYLWEIIEWNLEMGHSRIDRVTYWFQGVEFWVNRLITDPSLMLLGYLLSTRSKPLISFAKVFYPIWWIPHLFLFPHCMYLQELL